MNAWIAHAEHGSVRIHFGLDITDKFLIIGLRIHFAGFGNTFCNWKPKKTRKFADTQFTVGVCQFQFSGPITHAKIVKEFFFHRWCWKVDKPKNICDWLCKNLLRRVNPSKVRGCGRQQLGCLSSWHNQQCTKHTHPLSSFFLSWKSTNLLFCFCFFKSDSTQKLTRFWIDLLVWLQTHKEKKSKAISKNLFAHISVKMRKHTHTP